MARQADTLWNHLSEWLDKNARPSWRPEVAYQLQDDWTPKTLGRLTHARRYPEGGILAGTPDVVCQETRVIYDFKCTRFAPWPAYWPQLDVLGLMAFDGEPFRTELVHVTDVGVFTNPEQRERDAFDVLQIKHDLKMRLTMVPSSEPKPGSWCREKYCPIRTTCAAHLAIQPHVNIKDNDNEIASAYHQ